MNNLLIIISFLLGNTCFSYSISQLKQDLLNHNIDLKLIYNRAGISKERLNIAKAYDYPTLEFSSGATTSSQRDSNVTSASTSAPSSDLGGGPSTGSASYSTPADSWSADMTLKYVAFSKFNITSNINSASNQYKIDQITYQMQQKEKTGQLYQLLLEAQALRKMNRNLDRAETIITQIRNRRKNSKFKYSKKYSLDLDKKYYKLQYQKEKLLSAIRVVKEGLKDLLPNSKADLYDKGPNLKFQYFIPKLEEAKEKFKTKSKSIKKMDLLINTYEVYHDATNWDKFYIPNIVLSSSLSKQGDFEGTQQNETNDVSVSLLLTFNLFEGYASLARKNQAFYAKELAKKRKLSEIQKRIIYLTKLHSDALVSEKEYLYRNSIVKEKEQGLAQLEIVGKRGSSTEFEKTLLRLEITNAKYDAYEAQKKHQNAAINLALVINELDKVNIHEI